LEQRVCQIFLDANTFLGFYSLTPADISELEKLVELVKLKKVRLLLPTQVINEVARNRSKVIAERLKPLRESRLQVSIPQMVEKPEADALRKAVAEAQRAHTAAGRPQRRGTAGRASGRQTDC
jgi:hypothetical protein